MPKLQLQLHNLAINASALGVVVVVAVVVMPLVHLSP